MGNVPKNMYENYIKAIRAKEGLGLDKKTFNEFIEEYGLEYITLSYGGRYFKREDIYFFIQQQEYIGKDYLTAKMIKDRYGFNINFKNNKELIAPAIRIPTCLRNKRIVHGCLYVYEKSLIEEYVKKINKKKRLLNTSGTSEYDSFLAQLDVLDEEINTFNNSVITKEAFLLFARKNMNVKKIENFNSRSDIILRCLNIVHTINNSLITFEKQELHMLKSAQLIITGNNVAQSYRSLFCVFLDFFTDVLISKNIKFMYSLKRVKDSISIKRKEYKQGEIYSEEEFRDLVTYTADIKKHITLAIEEIERNQEPLYLSTWLYVLLHLNNTWRRNDVANFPRLPFENLIKKYEISNLRWFETYELDDETVSIVVSTASNHSYLFAKTNEYGQFFCSERLAKPIATILLTFEVYYTYYCKDTRIPKYNEPIMSFANQRYAFPKDKAKNTFFATFNHTNFSFASKKMNRTVMTMVYNTACKIAPSGYNELLLPKHMRAHLKESTTLHYIEFSERDLEHLPFELYKIGELGYIICILLEFLSIDCKTQKERNKILISIRENFGKSAKIESVMEMLNSEIADPDNMTNNIEKYGLTKYIEVLTNLYCERIPNNLKQYRCLLSEHECHNIDNNCYACRFSIPAMYVIKTVSRELFEEMTAYHSAYLVIEKLKLSINIYRKIDIFAELISLYGKEYIYSFLDISRDEFVSLFNGIEEPQYLVNFLKK